MPWRRERLPTPVFWPGEFHGLCRSWGCKESDTAEWLELHCTGKISRRRKPTPVFLPGKVHGQRSLAGSSPWGGKESGIAEQAQQQHVVCMGVC